MTEPEVGKTYLYRKLSGQCFHVDVLRVAGWFALCQYDCHVIGFGGEYDVVKIKWKPIWRFV